MKDGLNCNAGLLASGRIKLYTAQNPTCRSAATRSQSMSGAAISETTYGGTALPDQDIKQVWFAGVHSDVGGSCAEAESGLSKIALEWMLCEAVGAGLLVDRHRAEVILGRIPPSPPVPADPGARMHNS